MFQVFGRKRHAVAVAHCKRGSGMVRVNGAPIETVQPSILRYKVLEPLLLLGKSRFDLVDIRIRVRGGGYTSQIYGMGSESLSPSFFVVVVVVVLVVVVCAAVMGDAYNKLLWERKPFSPFAIGLSYPLSFSPLCYILQPSAKRLPSPWLLTTKSVRLHLGA
jgi:hypothetical protein